VQKVCNENAIIITGMVLGAKAGADEEKKEYKSALLTRPAWRVINQLEPQAPKRCK